MGYNLSEGGKCSKDSKVNWEGRVGNGLNRFLRNTEGILHF